MSHPCIVLVASAAQLPVLTQRAAHAAGQLFAFADTDALQAFAVISEQRPAMIALEQQFAATSRGVALIRRLRADPSLTHATIQMVSPDTDFACLASPSPSAGGLDAAATSLPNQRGTRRTPRFRTANAVAVLVDGQTASLIDMSKLGAQVVSATVLKPNQRVRTWLSDERGTLRCSAVVAWALFEISPSRGAQYRAGIEFIDADCAALDAYCAGLRSVC